MTNTVGEGKRFWIIPREARIAKQKLRESRGTLTHLLEGRCPNLLTEAGMYRWGEAEDRRAEVPVDKDNHALAALRYLIATLDRHSFSKRLGKSASAA